MWNRYSKFIQIVSSGVLVFGPTASGYNKASDFHCLTWSSVDSSLSNMTSMVYYAPQASNVSQKNTETVAYLGQRPQGRRALLVVGANNSIIDLFSGGEDNVTTGNTTVKSPWRNTSVKKLRDHMITLSSAVKQAGGDVDYLIMDYEDSYHFWSGSYVGSASGVQAIEGNAWWNSLNTKLNLSDRYQFSRITYSSEDPHGDTLLDAYNRQPYDNLYGWNAVANALVAEQLNMSVYDPFFLNFPDVVSSNYSNSGIIPQERFYSSDLNGHYNYAVPSSPFSKEASIVGTHGALELYGRVGDLKLNKYYNGTIYGFSSLKGFLDSQQKLRAMQRSTGGSSMVWIAPKTWKGDVDSTMSYYTAPTPLAGSCYYDENIRHTILRTGGAPLLYWNYSATLQDNSLVDDLVEEVKTQVQWGEYYVENVDSINLNSDCYVTTISNGNSYLSRVTTTPYHRSVRNIHSLAEYDVVDYDQSSAIGSIGTWIEEVSSPQIPEYESIVDSGLVGLWKFESSESNTKLYPVGEKYVGGASLIGNSDLSSSEAPVVTQDFKLGAENKKCRITAFDGEYLSQSSSDFNFYGESDLTFNVWVKTTDSNYSVPILSNGDYGSGYTLTLEYNGKPRIALDQKWSESITSNVSITDGKWHMVTVTLNDMYLRLYVDGVEQTQGRQVSGASISTSSNVFEVGRRKASGSHWFYYTGDVDEISVWNRPLNASEVQLLYNSLCKTFH